MLTGLSIFNRLSNLRFWLASVCVYAVLFSSTAHAGTFDAREVQQGSTVEVLIPQHDLSSVKGTFDGDEVFFYPYSKEPPFDEAITRAEFLKLIFLNHDFGEVDVSLVKDFPDVQKDNSYYDVIQKAAALNIISGYEDGLFRPYTPVTRGQIAKILVNAFDPHKVLDEAPQFPDVQAWHIFYGSINHAVRAKIFQGYPDGLMRPDRDINFSEAETVIRRAAGLDKFTDLGDRNYFRGFVGINRLSQIGTKDLQLDLFRDKEVEKQAIHMNIVKRDFPVVSFSLAADKTKLFGKEEQDNTWVMIDAAKANPDSQKLWKGAFIVPTSGEMTLGFGDKLYINGVYSGSHFGWDLANDEGTEVYASNSGKVTLSAWTTSYGNTVVIDHGQNIFTMYLHLSELKTQEGLMIEKGDLIGLMGATGIATGSHLHFTQFIGGVVVDSQDWVDGKF
ncbi:peptidoglycan DD-metalloendopeptidase family protein [Candidatus Peregrinibacteria bacterium]|nr:peptidoglycan DD-metalloendopeptidase family protein [Candidatus Peregrinibacteria bacterium]